MKHGNPGERLRGHLVPDAGLTNRLGEFAPIGLARQLGAVIVVTDGRPGTHVAIGHMDILDVAVPRLALAGR